MMPPSREDVDAAADRARRLGAVDGHDDCVGGDIRAPWDCSAVCSAAVREYKRLARSRHSWVWGPALRDYYTEVQP